MNTKHALGPSYTIRYNIQHRGHILISCCYGHPVSMVSTGRTFGGSAAEARIAYNDYKCRDCESLGIAKAERR